MILLWVFLLLLVSRSKQDGHQTGVSQCGPQNLTVSSSDQTVLVTWEDNPSCLALKEPILYKMTVLIEQKENHSEEILVEPDDIGGTHSWTWTSPLPLECASHTFRLRSQTSSQTSQLEQETTLPGETGSGENVFPQDAVLEAGSMATFCCIVPDGEQFERMIVQGSTGKNMSTNMISEQRYALTLQLEPVRDRCVDVSCHTKEPTQGPYGSCVFIGYPPDVGNFRCETRDLESVECSWDVRDTLVELKSPTNYQLDGSNCTNKPRSNTQTCSKEFKVEGGEKNWTLTAWNKLGKLEIQETVDLTKRVRMLAPDGVKASEVNTRNATLSWSWTVEQYNSLNLTCRINILNEEENMEHGVGLNAAVLTDLTPNWKYEVKVQCRTAQHSWKWGDWSKNVVFRTEGDVPDALDVWMKKEENQTVIVWKMPLANQSHGDITEYEVTWARTSDLNHLHNATVPPGNHRYPLSLNTSEEHVTTVTARNKHGRSPPSTITIPAFRPNETSMTPSRITGSNGGLELSWNGSPNASCGYVVDWGPAVGDGPVDWLKLPPSQTSVRITSKNFTDGLRYSLSIYACTRTAPLLLEKKEGYVTETPIQKDLFQSLQYEQKGSDVKIYWDRVPLREQSAFINGYILYYQEMDHQVSTVTTDDPEATSLVVKNLKSSLYSFTVAAQTAVGVCCNKSINATLDFQTDSIFMTFFISLFAVFVLLLIITVLCYRHWGSITEAVFPQIPKPIMSDWMTSPVKTNLPFFQTDPSFYPEEPMDIPVLHYESGKPLNNHTQQEDEALISSQSPDKSHNDPVQGFNTLPLISDPNLPALSDFTNLSYNHCLPGEDQSPDSEPKPQVSKGYKPPSVTELLRQNQTDPIPPVLEYIMQPQPST